MVSPDLLDEDEDQRSLLDFARSHRPALPDFSEDESGRSEVDLDDLSARMGPSDLEDFDPDGKWGGEGEVQVHLTFHELSKIFPKKFVYCRNQTSYENFKLRLCTCAQSIALGT